MNELYARLSPVLATTPGRWSALAEALPIELFQRIPAPGEWSAIDCLRHLRDVEHGAGRNPGSFEPVQPLADRPCAQDRFERFDECRQVRQPILVLEEPGIGGQLLGPERIAQAQPVALV